MKNGKLIGIMFAATTLVASAAHADVFSGSYYEIAATADITPVYDSVTGKTTITLVLTNNSVDPQTSTDLLTGIEISNTDNFTTAMITGRSAQFTTVGSNMEGTVPAAATFTDWKFENVGGYWALTMHPGASHGIIGPPTGFDGANPVWDTVDNSIAGNGSRNPYIYETATFTLTVPFEYQLDSSSFVRFQFGTSFEAYFKVHAAAGSGVPEPASLALLAPVAGLLLRRRRGR